MTDPKHPRDFIRHVVFFTAKDPADLPKIIEGLKILGGIPGVQNFDVAQSSNTDPLTDRVDVVVYGEFADEAALTAYRTHPLYQESIRRVRPLRDTRVAADF
ncbi:stress responsive protein [Thalassobacter stenotrophicus]|uniref:Dabb family protein n=1 Tax=Thalassobacter TaxID=266808 RepID=UPI00051FEC72|nr:MULTISPECIES: Dabb family protein [Thalassobacter]KGK79038.1 stress responsive protein [Thalassobacter stenotrophicus]